MLRRKKQFIHYGEVVSDFVVIAGLSGAGRSQAGNSLEDLGWFVIDNLPPLLIPKVAELAQGPRSETPKVALIVGSGPGVEQLELAISELRASGAAVRLVYLDASTDVLVRRYEATKRRHPLSQGSLSAAIESERELLQPVRESADLIIDTTDKTIYDLRGLLVDLFSDDEFTETMQTTVMSFGYKFGIPNDVDVVIDCRFLPNPYWDEHLRPLSGRDQEIVDYLWSQDLTEEFIRRLESLLELLVPAYRAEGKAYLTIAMGCTGGRHRSVAVAEAVARSLEASGLHARVTHRDIEK